MTAFTLDGLVAKAKLKPGTYRVFTDGNEDMPWGGPVDDLVFTVPEPAAAEAGAGTPGAPGEPGAPGKSAYQTWLDLGHAGTEADFIASLKGEPGLAGADATGGSPATKPDFVSALNASWNAGQELVWPYGDVTLTAPIVLQATSSRSGGGIDMQGASIRVAFNDATKDAITVQIPNQGVDFRYFRLKNAKLWGNSQCRDGIVLSCRTNSSWIYNALFQDVTIEGCTRDGLVLDGSVFETQLRDFYASNNGRDGVALWNDGPAGDVGILSAIFWDGGGARKNGRHGLSMNAAADWTQPRNCRVRAVYFVENRGHGCVFPMGADDIASCGFENNCMDPTKCVDGVGAGVFVRNYGVLSNCIASSGGPQPYLVYGQLLSRVTLSDCGVEGYGSLTGLMKLAKLQNVGGGAKATLRGATAADIDNVGGVAVTATP